MSKLLAHVQRDATTIVLHYWQGQWLSLPLDSPAWFDWLAQERSFRYTYQTLNFTVRAEKRGQQTYWQGWKTIAGHTTKKYLGVSPSLTSAKLDEAGLWFRQQAKTTSDREQNKHLYAITIDLLWLTERLLETCNQPQVHHQATQELTRLKREVDELDHRFW